MSDEDFIRVNLKIHREAMPELYAALDKVQLSQRAEYIRYKLTLAIVGNSTCGDPPRAAVAEAVTGIENDGAALIARAIGADFF